MFDSLSLGRILADDTEDNTPACPFPKGRFPEDTPLAMAYVPFQMWEKPYEADVALSRGTIFPSIDKPFNGSRQYLQYFSLNNILCCQGRQDHSQQPLFHTK